MALLSGASNTAGRATSLAEEVEATHRSVKGHLELSPKYVRFFLNIECRDKQSLETYRKYFERLQGAPFKSNEWRVLCNISWEIIGKSKNLDEMDITALCNLYNCVFALKKHPRSTSKIRAELKKLKNLRNAVMHNIKSVNNPDALSEVNSALQAWIDVAGDFYSVPPNEILDLKNELDIDVKADFSQGKIKLLYACACVVKEGRDDVQRFLLSSFKNKYLMFGMGQVEWSAVFYSLKIRSRQEDENQVFPFSEIFEQSENIVIVSGVAGAGKSTLLENIALQFIQPQPDTSSYLTEFDLLVYVQCRDRSSKSLKQVIKQQFRNVCIKFGVEDVMEAIFDLKTLFLVDGFDECDPSMTVLQEIVKETSGTSCRIIITSRSNAVARLVYHLPGGSVREFEIMPLEKIEDQLDFLKKYEDHLPGTQPPGALRGCFKTLKMPLRGLFVQPLKLLQFCNVFVTFPEKISTWKLPSDAAKDIFCVYKNTVAKKLANVSYLNFDIVIDELFEVLCDAALNFLRQDKLIFTEEEVRQIQQKCRTMLRDEHNIKDLDTQVVLSSVLKMKRSPFSDGDTSYSFHHKTDEEYFASKSVVEKLSKGKICLKEILLGEKKESPDVDTTMNSKASPRLGRRPDHPPMVELQPEFSSVPVPPLYSFLQVLQYVVQELSSSHPQLFQQRREELKDALVDAGASILTFENLVLNCADNEQVVKWAAEAALADDIWEVKTERDLEAVALMLPYAQPATLSVVIHPLSLVGEHWTKIAQLMVGNLELKLLYTCGVMYTHHTPCDSALLPLQKCRCHLVSFEGLLSTAQGVISLASVAVPKTHLKIWLEAPLHLAALRGKYASLTIHAQLFVPEEEGKTQAPLPQWPLPNLVVTNPLPESWEAVVHTVLTLAPVGRRYKEVTLSSCEMDEAEIDRVLAALQRKGVRTHKVVTIDELTGQPPSGISRRVLKFKASGKIIIRGCDYLLVITNSLPAELAKLKKLLWLMDRFTKLSVNDPLMLKIQWPFLRKDLRAAGATFKDWQRLLLCYPELSDLARLAAERTLAKDQIWVMKTGREVDAVALMLPHVRPSSLFVNMDPVQLKATRWPEVARSWDGDLSLRLISDDPCDDVLLPLQHSRCRLMGFQGRITTADSVASIAALSTTETVMELWLQAPLELGALDGKSNGLGIYTKPIITSGGEGRTLSLPSGSPPTLTVEMSPLTSWQDVVDTENFGS